MRLTLRTMLAYLDDILEPEDAREIAKKIEESEFAGGLVQRVRDVTRRLRLAAPSADGSGKGLDANVVSEYLDNTLAADRVPDFEKVCLESDEYLAEVAASHQILTLVLGEPAQIEVSSRRRMYLVPTGADGGLDEPINKHAAAPPPVPVLAEAQSRDGNGAAAVEAEGSSEPPVQPDAAAGRRKREVPDYLRQAAASSRRNRMKAVVALLVATAAAVLIWLALGGYDPNNPVKQLADRIFGKRNAAPPAEPADDTSAKTPDIPPVTASPGPSGPAKDHTPGPVKPTPLIVPPPPGASKSAEKIDPGPVQPPPNPPIEPIDKFPPQDPPVPEPKGTQLAKVEPAETILPPRPAAGEEKLGQVVWDQQILLRQRPAADDGAGPWERMEARADLIPGDRLLALPAFRPTIKHNAGAAIKLGGGTLVTLEGSDEQGIPGIRIHYGRLLMTSVGANELRMRVKIGSQERLLAMANADLAIEVRPRFVVGVDPAKESTSPEADLYVTQGQIRWTDAAKEEEDRLEAPQHRRLAGPDSKETTVAADLPKWIISESVRGSEALAANQVVEILKVGRNVSLGIEELANDRKREVRALAVRAAAHTGQYGVIVESLNKPADKNEWAAHVKELQGVLARDPDSAVAVRLAIERRYGEAGAPLYAMLWSHGPENFDRDHAAQLIELLSHGELMFRVVASSLLTEITGLQLGGYEPEDRDVLREKAVSVWKRRLELGQLTPKGGTTRK